MLGECTRQLSGGSTDQHHSGAIQFCQDILLYGFSTFLPAILKGMGHSTLETQYLTIPVYIFGGICFMIFAYISDRMTLRSPVSRPLFSCWLF